MSSLFFLFTSIGFFLASIRLILFWTYIWQKNNYSLKFLLKNLKNSFRLRTFSGWILFLILLCFYGLFIFNDKFISIYQTIVFIVFISLGAVFVKEIFQASFIKPSFTAKSLAICFLSVFLISFLFSVPLVDNYVWLVLLILFMPFEIAIFVAFLAFPTEIYEDFITSKAVIKLRNLPRLNSLLLVGNDSKIMQRYISEVFNSKSKKVVVTEELGYLNILRTFNNDVSARTRIFLISSLGNDREIKRILKMFKPKFVVISKVSKIINFPKNLTLISHIDNKKIFRTGIKKILWYGKRATIKELKEQLRKIKNVIY